MSHRAQGRGVCGIYPGVKRKPGYIPVRLRNHQLQAVPAADDLVRRIRPENEVRKGLAGAHQCAIQVFGEGVFLSVRLPAPAILAHGHVYMRAVFWAVADDARREERLDPLLGLSLLTAVVGIWLRRSRGRGRGTRGRGCFRRSG